MNKIGLILLIFITKYASGNTTSCIDTASSSINSDLVAIIEEVSSDAFESIIKKCGDLPLRDFKDAIKIKIKEDNITGFIGGGCRKEYWASEDKVDCTNSANEVILPYDPENVSGYYEYAFKINSKNKIVKNKEYDLKDLLDPDSGSEVNLELPDKDLTLQDFSSVSNGKLELTLKDNFKCPEKHQKFSCTNAKDLPMDPSSIDKKNAQKKMSKDLVSVENPIKKYENSLNAVGYAYYAKYENGKKNIGNKDDKYTSNAYRIYKILSRPPCKDWTLKKSAFNFHNGEAGYALYYDEGRVCKTQFIPSKELFAHDLSKLYNSSSKIDVVSCWSAGPGGIANLLSFTDARVKGYKKVARPLRAKARTNWNPSNLSPWNREKYNSERGKEKLKLSKKYNKDFKDLVIDELNEKDKDAFKEIIAFETLNTFNENTPVTQELCNNLFPTYVSSYIEARTFIFTLRCIENNFSGLDQYSDFFKYLYLNKDKIDCDKIKSYLRDENINANLINRLHYMNACNEEPKKIEEGINQIVEADKEYNFEKEKIALILQNNSGINNDQIKEYFFNIVGFGDLDLLNNYISLDNVKLDEALVVRTLNTFFNKEGKYKEDYPNELINVRFAFFDTIKEKIKKDGIKVTKETSKLINELLNIPIVKHDKEYFKRMKKEYFKRRKEMRKLQKKLRK